MNWSWLVAIIKKKPNDSVITRKKMFWELLTIIVANHASISCHVRNREQSITTLPLLPEFAKPQPIIIQ